MPTYRTNGAWGAGIGVNLTPAQVDNNFYELRTDLDDVIANPPTADGLVSVTQSGFYLTFHTTLGNELGPIAIPVVYTVWRGDWAPFTIYSAADIFRVVDEGIFSVLQDHTSAATFDPDAAGGSPLAPYYNELIGVSTLPSSTLLDELNDVTITSVADGDLIAWDTGSSQWTNRTPGDVLALLAPTLDNLTDVIAPSPAVGQILRYLGGSPDAGWQPDTLILDDISDVVAPSPSLGQVLTWTGSPASWQPANVAADLDDLSDVSVPSPDDGDVLTYQAGSPTGWIAAAPAAIPTELDDLTDVIAPGPADGDLLQFDGSDWVNAAGEAVSDLGDATLPLIAASYIEVSEPAGSPAVYTSKKITASNLLAITNLSGAASGILTFLATPSSANLRAALTDESGTGVAYFQGGALGTPASGTLTNATGLPVSTGVSGLGAGVATFLATPSSANLAAAVTGETGSGALVFDTAPTIVTATLSGLTTISGNVSAAAWTTSGIGLRVVTATYTDTSSSGTVAEVAGHNIPAPTLAASSATTYTQAETMRIGGSPLAGANVTITNGYSLSVAGAVIFNSTFRVVNVSQFDSIVRFAGSTSSFPGLKRSSAELQVRLADDSADGALKALKITTSDTAFMHNTSAALANGAGAGAGTITNAPAAGNPTKWIPINDNGTTRYVPAW